MALALSVGVQHEPPDPDIKQWTVCRDTCKGIHPWILASHARKASEHIILILHLRVGHRDREGPELGDPRHDPRQHARSADIRVDLQGESRAVRPGLDDDQEAHSVLPWICTSIWIAVKLVRIASISIAASIGSPWSGSCKRSLKTPSAHWNRYSCFLRMSSMVIGVLPTTSSRPCRPGGVSARCSW